MVNLLLAVIYVAFISLGLPDAVLGAAWPTMSVDLGAPISWAGGISMTISAGTIVSALLSDRMTLHFGAGKVTAVSVALTALALFGFSVAPNYWVLILLAIPYGLGAGGVDAALNNYVAIHYESRHMSWLHAMWGIGALTGPYVMGFALGAGQGWPWGYRYISILQVALTAILIFSLPLWKKRSEAKTGEVSGESDGTANDETRKPLGVRGVLAIRGAKEILVMFFCYCALESTAMLWGSSYMVLGKGIDKTTAAMWASLFCIGITVGRLASGFLTMKFNDPTMIRLGQALVLTGIVSMLLPLPYNIGTIVGLMIIGLGCVRSLSRDRLRLRSDLSVRHSFHAGIFRRRQIAGDRRHADGMRIRRLDVHAAGIRPDRTAYQRAVVPSVHVGFSGAYGDHAREPA